MTTQKRGAKNVLASAGVGILIVVCFALGLSLISGESPFAFSGDSSSQLSTNNEVETHEVTDSVGRNVAVPVAPERIAAFDSFAGNVCVLVGADETLMGAPGGVTSNKLLQTLNPSLADSKQLSGNSINIETLLAENVDVAFVRKALYEGGDEVAKLEKMGIPYVVVDYQTIEEQMDAILLVGQTCGEEPAQRATDIVEYYKNTIALIEERTASIPEEEKVRVYHSINDPLLTDAQGSIGADWMRRSGTISVSAEEASTSGFGDYIATLEQVYVWSPDMIICSTAAAFDTILSNTQWQGLNAVVEGNVHHIPVSTSRWGQRGDPETFFGMLWLAKTAYPSLYEDIDLREAVTSYYQDIVGLEIDDATWEAIIASVGLRNDGSGGQNGAGTGSGNTGGR